jgi:hypothetical protein
MAGRFGPIGIRRATAPEPHAAPAQAGASRNGSRERIEGRMESSHAERGHHASSFVPRRAAGSVTHRPRAPRRRGGALLLGRALAAAVACPPAFAQVVELTVDPVMVRGPADAPVTIVEFADYQ